MDNFKFTVLLVLLVALVGGLVYLFATREQTASPPAQPASPSGGTPPAASRCPLGLCGNDRISHISMIWTNETNLHWTIKTETHAPRESRNGKIERSTERIGPHEGCVIDGILAGHRETIVENQNGERWVWSCDVVPGHNHAMVLRSEGAFMLMPNGKYMKAGNPAAASDGHH